MSRESSDISLFDIVALMENGDQVIPTIEPETEEPLNCVYSLLRDCVEDVMRSLTLEAMVTGDRSEWENVINEAVLREDTGSGF